MGFKSENKLVLHTVHSGCAHRMPRVCRSNLFAEITVIPVQEPRVYRILTSMLQTLHYGIVYSNTRRLLQRSDSFSHILCMANSSIRENTFVKEKKLDLVKVKALIEVFKPPQVGAPECRIMLRIFRARSGRKLVSHTE